MGGGYDLSQCKGALKGTMDRCEFTDKSLALSIQSLYRICIHHPTCYRIPVLTRIAKTIAIRQIVIKGLVLKILCLIFYYMT